MTEPAPIFFETAAAFRQWLTKHHQREQELWVGFRKRESKFPSLTWPESVDAALCFGWIDGLRKSIDETSYKIRFTPRKLKSKWSGVNLRRAQQLIDGGLMQAAGLKAFNERTVQQGEHYAYEQRHQIQLSAEQEEIFRRNTKAWAFFQEQAAWYRKTALWWVVSAKREETRFKRLQELINDSEQRLPIKQLDRDEVRNERAKKTRSDGE